MIYKMQLLQLKKYGHFSFIVFLKFKHDQNMLVTGCRINAKTLLITQLSLPITEHEGNADAVSGVDCRWVFSKNDVIRSRSVVITVCVT